MQSLLAIIVVFGGLVFIHELGHFLVARLFNMGVSRFSIGFGPKLLAKTYGKTEYRLSAIPLGGYVALVGEQEGEEIPQGFTEKDLFSSHPAWQRLCVVLAGATFNILLAVVIYFCIFYFAGKSYILPIVGEVTPNSPASIAQLQPGDSILRINNVPVSHFEDIRERTQINAGATMSLTIRRASGSEQTVDITPVRSTSQNIFGENTELWVLGITPSTQTGLEYLDGFSALKEGIQKTYQALELTVLGLIKMIQGKIPKDSVGGPIMIAQVIHDGTKHGIVAVATIAAFISINLGFINLLPIPVLDGGHAVFLLIEMIQRKPVSIVWKERFNKVGLALLFALMAFAMYNDIFRLFRS